MFCPPHVCVFQGLNSKFKNVKR
ncbi:rCG27768 [Rattus norvegicus]|uniref:RCG27768 n=1 Tax=Rattus norvegicus TaxID=10116 RepID=A6KBN5_RAT|nr:rCG27768 [Rattus norvegicus]